MKQTIISLAQKNSLVPKSPPSRLWFMYQGYRPIDPTLVFGRIFYIRVKGMEVSVLNANGQKALTRIRPNNKGAQANKIHGRVNQYNYLTFSAEGRTRQVPISLLVMATYNNQVPDRSKGEVIDHIDGNTLNNNPRNLRIVSDAINRRDGGFLKKLRNNGYKVAMFPGIILAGYERMARWKAEHKKWQYEQLSGKDLFRVFIGPEFKVLDIDPMDLDFAGHPEF